MRWSDEKSRRFQDLREAEARGPLTDVEQGELTALLADLDADEAEDLRPEMDRAARRRAALEAEQATLAVEADELVRIASEQEKLLADATAYLQRLRARSAALDEDYRRVTGRSPAPQR